MPTIKTFFWTVTVAVVALMPYCGMAQETMAVIERLVNADPKPFVLVEAAGQNTIARGQGVIISSRGYVLSAGHVSWIQSEMSFTDKFRISLRGSGKGYPDGSVHVHQAVFSDREDAAFFEHYYDAKLLQQEKSRFVGGCDLALFQMKTEGDLPKLDFFSQGKPTVELGETIYLCHYNSPHGAADPTFLINPVKVVGVAQTSSGLQYLAEGYYRVGSSGGALLKNGRLIGIQSAAYTVNAENIGEIPLGLISFQLVWGELFEGLLNDAESEPAD